MDVQNQGTGSDCSTGSALCEDALTPEASSTPPENPTKKYNAANYQKVYLMWDLRSRQVEIVHPLALNKIKGKSLSLIMRVLLSIRDEYSNTDAESLQPSRVARECNDAWHLRTCSVKVDKLKEICTCGYEKKYVELAALLNHYAGASIPE